MARKARVEPATVVAAVERDLRVLAARGVTDAGDALAATALVMAEQLDLGETSATAKANCARVLTEAMVCLREMAPPVVKGDSVDELNARRVARRTGT